MTDKSIRLKKSAIDKLPTPEKGYAIYWGDKLSGFGVRITASGIKAFIFRRRINGGYLVDSWPVR